MYVYIYICIYIYICPTIWFLGLPKNGVNQWTPSCGIFHRALGNTENTMKRMDLVYPAFFDKLIFWWFKSISSPLLFGDAPKSCGYLSPFDDYRLNSEKHSIHQGPTCLTCFFPAAPKDRCTNLGVSSFCILSSCSSSSSFSFCWLSWAIARICFAWFSKRKTG